MRQAAVSETFGARVTVVSAVCSVCTVHRVVALEMFRSRPREKNIESGEIGAWKDGETAQPRTRRVAVVFPMFPGWQLSLVVGRGNVRS